MIIIVALLMLVTGGFFGLKMKGGGSAPKIKLGEGADHILQVHEFLVNLNGSNDGGKYLRTEVWVQTVESFKKEDLDANLAPVEDAINSVLRKYSVDEIKGTTIIPKLKHEIAEAANKAYFASDPKASEAWVKIADEHSDWDSTSGPFVKVFFTTFAFQ